MTSTRASILLAWALLAAVGMLADDALANDWRVLAQRDLTTSTAIRIPIGKDAGAFSRIELVVENGDLSSVELALQFINGGPGPQHWRPDLTGGPGRRIELDLPGTNRTLRWLELKRVAPSPAHLRVVVRALRIGGATAADPQTIARPVIAARPPARAEARSHDAQEWHLLAERAIRATAGTEAIVTKRTSKVLRQLRISSSDDLEILEVVVRFAAAGPGLAMWRPLVATGFLAHGASAPLELPPTTNAVHSVQITYRGLGGAPAKISIWGK